jgi:cell division septation protein DedD
MVATKGEDIGTGRHMCAVRHIIFFSVFLGLTVAPVAVPVTAQIAGSSQGGESLISAGETAMEKGQFDVAAAQFGRALRAGDLDDKQVAYALYQRGVAQERDGKPAQAIADLTSALYLPQLPADDRAKAYLVRARAYEAVGLNDLARSDIARAKSGGVDERQVASSAVPPAQGSDPSFSTRSSSGSRRTSVPSFETSSQTASVPAPSFETRSGERPPAAPRRQRAAVVNTQSRTPASGEEEIPRFRTTIAPQETGIRAPAPQRSAAAPPASGWSTAASGTQEARTQVKQESGSGVGRYIGNLWSRAKGNDKDTEKDRNTQTAAAEPTSPPPPQWNQTTRASEPPAPAWNAQVSAPAATRPPAPPVATAQPAPAAAAGGSGYRIQLAALRSDEEARATWKRLQSRHRELLGNRQPNIVRTELGGLGTFYRVQLGPFADKASSQELCKTFKAGGLDCFLLAP